MPGSVERLRVAIFPADTDKNWFDGKYEARFKVGVLSVSSCPHLPTLVDIMGTLAETKRKYFCVCGNVVLLN